MSPTLVPTQASKERDQAALQVYLWELAHDWSKTLTVLGFTLVPLFFFLDYFTVPPEKLTRFAVYRLAPTVVAVGQYVVLRLTRPGRYSFAHGYILTLCIGGAIALMTTELGGFDSAYYAGLNLVTIAIVVLPPWGFKHATINALLVLALWFGFNLAFPSESFHLPSFLNNLYFLSGTAIIGVSINVVKQSSIEKEFLSRSDLKAARDALWGEMELAKQIQTSLLPKAMRLPGYRVAAKMIPAAEVGGDYYDVMETAAGETWVAVGDVSGHGVESGLIMMMTQTSLFSTVNRTPGYQPSRALELVNSVVTQNISRLNTDRYMTMCALRLDHERVTFAGKHQDLLVYRRVTGAVDAVPTTGTWLGVVEDLGGRLTDTTIEVGEGDVLLLYTDGVTEAMDLAGRMFGQERLEAALGRLGKLDAEAILQGLLDELNAHSGGKLEDDVTLVVLKRVQTGRRAEA